MDNYSIFLIATGLSADAFSAAFAKGSVSGKNALKSAFKTAFMFGLFQFIMPLAGLLAGTGFMSVLSDFSELIASGMLFVIGGKMLYDAISDNIEDDGKTTFLGLIIPALATSIDALALGFTLSCFKTDILFASSVIGITAFILSFSGFFIGKKFSLVSKKYAAVTGACVLLFLALKFLISFLR